MGSIALKRRSEMLNIVFIAVAAVTTLCVLGYFCYVVYQFYIAADVGYQEANPNKHQGWACWSCSFRSAYISSLLLSSRRHREDYSGVKNGISWEKAPWSFLDWWQ